MQEFQRRDREISRRETEKMRAELIVNEMASAVRVLGGEGTALMQNNKAARAVRRRHDVLSLSGVADFQIMTSTKRMSGHS